MLLEAGAHISTRAEGGMTALLAAAASNDDPAVIHALLDAGAVVDEEDDEPRGMRCTRSVHIIQP